MDRIAQAGRLQGLGVALDAGNYGKADTAQSRPSTVYENVLELAKGIRDMRPASRTSAEAINIILSGMDAEARQRTLRALGEVYETQTA